MELYNKLVTQLEKEPNYVSDDGELKKWVVISKAQNGDEELISLLLQNDELKTAFFKNVADCLIFDQQKFLLFIEQKSYLLDSYTKYRKKVGLTIGGKFLSQRNEVELVWPYKDCILEGGQTREEQKRDEIFFNQTLAQDEITQLFDPKVLTNAKRYTAEGEKPFDVFNRDAEINRKRGLSENTITDNMIIKGNNLLALHSLVAEFTGKVKLIYIDPPFNTGNDSFSYNDSFNHSSWLTFMKNRLEIAKELLSEDGSIIVHTDWNECSYLKLLLDEIFGRDNFRNEIIWCYTGPGSPMMSQLNRKHDNLLWYSKSSEWAFNGDDVRMESEVHAGGFNGEMNSEVSGEYSNKGKIPEDWWELFHTEEDFIDEMKRLYSNFSELGTDWLKMAVASRIRVDGWKRTGYLTEKPYKLMERIVKMASSKDDIVLDFFAGSGTTGYVCSYLDRQYLLVEQLDDTIEKLAKRFYATPHLYFELKKYNQVFMEEIQAAEDTEALLHIWEDMKSHSFLNYNIDIKQHDAHIKEFKSLTLEQEKQTLCELLDKNQLYVNLSSLDDEDFACTEAEKQVTLDFYGRNE